MIKSEVNQKIFSKATRTNLRHLWKSDENKTVLNIFLLRKQNYRAYKRLLFRFARAVNRLERKKFKNTFRSNHR